MATTTQAVVASARSTANPLALWHLLSLDAPTVAALWTWFIARANHLELPMASTLAMGVAVWMLYAADRLLDARLLHARPLDPRPLGTGAADVLEARHYFHHRHRAGFLAGIGLAATLLAALLPSVSPAALALYSTEGALLFAWFLLLHASRSARRLPKEIAVGLFFAAAVFIPTVARGPHLRPDLLPAAALFAALCSLNCLYIYAWEHEGPSESLGTPPHPTTRVALRHLTALALTATAAAALLIAFGGEAVRLIASACALSILLLLALNRIRYRLPRTTLRAAADLALLTPLAVLALLK